MLFYLHLSSILRCFFTQPSFKDFQYYRRPCICEPFTLKMPLTPKIDDERLRQTVQIGVGIYTARPASPRGSVTRMINVLSEPQLGESLESSPNNAVTSLQKTLDKSDTKMFTSHRFDSEGSETSQLEISSLGSGSSIRVATSAARVIVAGLFGRRKRSEASLSDGKVHSEEVQKCCIIPNSRSREV